VSQLLYRGCIGIAVVVAAVVASLVDTIAVWVRPRDD